MAVSSGLLAPQEAEQGLEDLATSLNYILSLKVSAPLMFCICNRVIFLDLERSPYFLSILFA
jgi:hypothetical protein